MTNPNVNCLKGKRCPACGSYGPFKVLGESFFRVTDDGTEAGGDIEFNESHTAECYACNVGRQWKEFDDISEIPMKTYTVIGIYRDGGGRYATSVEARNPKEAEVEAEKQCRSDNSADGDVIDLSLDVGQTFLEIAAVVEGSDFRIVA